MNRKFFDIKEKLEEVTSPSLPQAFLCKYLNSHNERISSIDDLIRIPTEGEIFFLQSDKAFNAFTFIPMIARANPIKELYACTYSINKRVIEALVELHDKGMIEQLTLLVSDSMIKRNPVVIDTLRGIAANKPNMTVLFAWVHAKVCILKTETDHYIVEGSGNWSENAQYEQYILANSKEVYEFRKNLFTNTQLKKY